MLSSLISAPRMLRRSVLCNGTLAEWLVRLDSLDWFYGNSVDEVVCLMEQLVFMCIWYIVQLRLTRFFVSVPIQSWTMYRVYFIITILLLQRRTFYFQMISLSSYFCNIKDIVKNFTTAEFLTRSFVRSVEDAIAISFASRLWSLRLR